MNKKLYIHIGMPKTGSSAIQAFLALNTVFLQKNNFSFPWHPGFGQAYQTSSGNASQLHHWILKGDFSDFKSKLNEITEDNIVLSSEVLFHTCRLEPRKFADFFSGFDIKIICYIRKVDDLVESCVNQLVKNHGLVDYSNFDKILEDHDYSSTLMGLTRFVDQQKIIVRPYGKNQFKKGNIYSDFLACMGLTYYDGEDITYPNKIVNPSLNRDAFEFRRFLNSLSRINDNDEIKYRTNGLLAKYSVESDNHNNQILNIEDKERIEKSFKFKLLELSKKFFKEKKIFENDSEYKKLKDWVMSREKISEILQFIFDRDKEVFELILDSILMSEPERIFHFSYILSALRGNFFPNLFVSKNDNISEISDTYFSSYLTSFLNLEKSIIGVNHKKNLFGYSDHILSIDTSDQGFKLVASGEDPYFSISPIDSKNRQIYSVVIGIDAPKETILQLHYQTFSEPFYGNRKFFNRQILPGKSEVVFHVLINDFNGLFRIDPGTTDGIYNFTHIIIFSNYLGEISQYTSTDLVGLQMGSDHENDLILNA